MVDPSEAQARDAELTDAAIDAALTGRRIPGEVDVEMARAVGHLAVVLRPPVPREVAAAVRGRLEADSRIVRRWELVVRGTAAVLAGLLFFQGVPSLLASEALAEFLGLRHEPHIYQEVGILAVGVAIGLLAAVFRPRILSGVLAVALPAALGLGIFGLTELPHSPNPSAEFLHVAQAAAALALGALWYLRRRRA